MLMISETCYAAKSLAFRYFCQYPQHSEKKLRKVAATNDPVSSARFFKIIIDAFIKHMIISGEEGGIFGPCDSYFATTEASGRGALHFHCLVWITGNVAIHNLRGQIV